MTFPPADAPPLPRADRPDQPDATKGFFPFGETHLRGLDIWFWLLCLYFFVGIGAIDEEWEAVAKLRPRLILGSLILVALVIRIAGVAFSGRRAPSPPDAVTGWWGAYAVATLLAVAWAFDFSLAREDLLESRFTALLSFPLVLAFVRTRRAFLVLVLVFSLAHGFYLLRSFQEFLAGRHLATMGVTRMVGAGSSAADPNSFAATVAFSLPLLLWAGIHTRSPLLRLCVAAYGVLSVLAIVLTRSRSGLILLALVSIWFLVALPRGRARKIGILLLVVAGLIATTRLSDQAIQRYRGMFTGGSRQDEQESTEGRIRGYRVAWKVFVREPITGVGPGNWSAYRMRKIDGDTLMPHNLPGQLIATLGLLGTITFAGYLVASFCRGRRIRRERKDETAPWERAVRSFAGAMLFTLFLLLVSGLAAHNLGRWIWYWAPALMIVAATARPAPESAEETSA